MVGEAAGVGGGAETCWILSLGAGAVMVEEVGVTVRVEVLVEGPDEASVKVAVDVEAVEVVEVAGGRITRVGISPG